MAKRKQYDVITIGGSVRDVSFYTSGGQFIATPHNLTAQRMLAFEYGAKINVREAHFTLGGGAANTAMSFRRLGLRTGIISCVGKDESAEAIVHKLKAAGIDGGHMQRSPLTRSGLSLIISQDKKEREHIVFTYRGANDDLHISPQLLARRSTRWTHITSLSGVGWQKNLRTLFTNKPKYTEKISWNPGALQLAAGKRVLGDFLRRTDVLILNKDEAIELALSGLRLGRRNPSFLNRPVYLLNILQDWGPKIIVVTLGPKGAWAFDGKKVYQQRCVRAKVLDTCGVGDAFGSSFVAGLDATGGNIAKALRWGAVNSGSVVSKIGAQNGLLTRKELSRKL